MHNARTTHAQTQVQQELIPMVRSLPSHDDNQFGSVALDDIIIHVGAFYDNTCMEVGNPTIILGHNSITRVVVPVRQYILGYHYLG